jgi:hypothetical protein
VAAPWDLLIEQGADFLQTYAWSTEDGDRKDFDDVDAFAQIRTRPGADLLLDLTPHLSVVNGVVLADGSTGQGLKLAVPGSATEQLARGGTWDLLLVDKTDPGAREFLLYGRVSVRKAVTRA